MKGILLAGGLGERMRPGTKYYNKHTYPVGGSPLIIHGIEAFVQAGITNILICSNGEDRASFGHALGTGAEFGCELSYRMEKEVKGSGQTILLAEPFVGADEQFIVMHGDSVFFRDSSLRHPLPWLLEKRAPHLFVMPTPTNDFDDPRKYGQAQLSANDGVVALKENEPPGFSNFIQIAVWIFRRDAFTCIRKLQQEHGGEVRTAEIVQEYIKNRHQRSVNYTMLPARSYIDCGTWPAMRKAEELLLKEAVELEGRRAGASVAY